MRLEMSKNNMGPMGPVPTQKATKLLILNVDSILVRKVIGPGRPEQVITKPEQVAILPGVLAKMRLWKQDGGRIVGISDQGAVTLGLIDYEASNDILYRTYVLTEGMLDKISVCIHHPNAVDPEYARCWCRKPSPGAFIEAVRELSMEHNGYYPPYMGLFVGDQPEDRECARLSGFDFVLVSDWRGTL
jgi:D-glycero-D-manno-heptose 1,7-bisphosphate phosphatase